MYISSRLADGLVLYRDITSPQPPLHLYIGSVLAPVGRLLGLEPYVPFRAFQVLLRLSVAAIVACITYRLFRCWLATGAAFTVYLILPIGYWWTRGYQSEPLELVPMSLVFLLLLDKGEEHASTRNAVLAGVCSSLAIATNMTYAPYLCFHILYLVLARRRLLIPFLVPLVAILGGGILFFSWYAGPAFIENVWSNQVGTFPQGPAVWMQRILRDLNETLQTEGPYILLACLGLWIYASQSESKQRDYVLWYALSSLGSIVFTAKGGTRNYIFSLGEPMVAVFAGYYLAHLTSRFNASAQWPEQFPLFPRSLGTFGAFTLSIVLLALLIAVSLTGLIFVISTTTGAQYELSAERARPLLQTIQMQTDRGDPIIAPPYYAFMTGCTIAEECSETYILAMRYAQEVEQLWIETRSHMTPPTERAEAERLLLEDMKKPEIRTKYKAIDLFVRLNEGLSTQRYPLVLLNISPRNLFGNLWILRQPLTEQYTQVPLPDALSGGSVKTLACRNEELAMYRPISK